MKIIQIEYNLTNGESGLLFKTGNAQEVNDYLIEYFTQLELAEKLSNGAYKVFESKYSYDKMIDNYIKIFNE